MTTFEIGDNVFDKAFPTLKGRVTNILPEDPEIEENEIIVVKIWIPKDEPGFWFTGIYESMWFGPDELEKV